MFVRKYPLCRPDGDEFASTGGIDPAAFAADMFPSSDTGASSADDAASAAVSSATVASAEEASTPATQAAAGAAADAGMSQAQYDALPKAWRTEMEAEWKAASPSLRKYVHEREQQVTNGIKGYKTGSDNWGKIMAPFQEILREYPDVNPTDILSTLAQNHIAMVRATPAERAHHAMALARGYGVELTPAEARAVAAAGAVEATPSSAPAGFSPGQMQELQRLLAPVQRVINHTQAQTSAAAEREVDAFFSDSKNQFVNEVADDILSLMQTGKAESLAEAYEIAVLRNPAVKAKYLATLVPPPPAPLKAPNVLNLKSTATPQRAAKSGTIDQTIDDIVKKHYS